MRTSESPALSLMASNCSLEMHSWTFPSPWMPLAAALHLMARRPEGRATREGAKLGVSSESRVAAMFAFVPCAGAGGKPSVRKV